MQGLTYYSYPIIWYHGTQYIRYSYLQLARPHTYLHILPFLSRSYRKQQSTNPYPQLQQFTCAISSPRIQKINTSNSWTSPNLAQPNHNPNPQKYLNVPATRSYYVKNSQPSIRIARNFRCVVLLPRPIKKEKRKRRLFFREPKRMKKRGNGLFPANP